MDVPVRVVCEGCLRSVEIAPGQSESDGFRCPYCDQPLLSHSGPTAPDELETRFQGAPPEVAFQGPEGPAVVDWLATWVRGTLGSLGRYQLRERLGNGGFGQVFLAHDPRLDRDVALKVLRLPKASDRVLERFFREARAVARLDHPNIAAVYDAGFDDGQSWVAYQLVSGQPLWWYRDQQRMAPDAVARVVRDLADALDHAHRMGVVHRDIKPANVLIDELGRPRLIDFGLARRPDLDSDLTRDGAVIGTPAYMSPEQAIGRSRQADERSDVYSLGVTFCDLLHGKRHRGGPEESSPLPFRRTPGQAAPSPRAERERRSANDFPVPADLAAICAQAMADRPEDRYASARDLADALDLWLRNHEGPTARPRRRLAPLVAAAACSAALTALAFSVAWSFASLGRHERPSPNSPGPLAVAAVAPSPSMTDAAPLATVPNASGPASKAADTAPFTGPFKTSGKLQPDEGTKDAPTSAPPAVGDASPAVEGPSPAPAPLPANALIGNRVSRRYHRSNCPSLLKMREEHRVELESTERAESEGFRPCGHCRPDQSIETGAETVLDEGTGDVPP